MKYLFIYLFIYLSATLSSQEIIVDWDECFGGELYWSIANAIDVLPNGSIVTSITIDDNNEAYTNYHGDADEWVLILDSSGNIIENRCFGGGGEDVFQDIEVYNDYIYFIGYTQSIDGDVQSEPIGGYVDLWVVKTDFDLNIIWERRYGCLGTQQFESAEVTEEGGLVLLMDFFVSGGGDVSEYYGNTDIWVCEIDADGEILWEKTLGNTYGTFASNVLQTADGKTIVLGEMDIWGDMVECQGHNNNGTRDIWIVALDETGEILWQNCYGGSDWEIGGDIIQDGEGYTFIAFTQSNDGDVSFNHGATNDETADLWLVHVDNTGNILWEKSFGGTDNDFGKQIFKTINNGYFLFGVSNSNDGDVNHSNCPDNAPYTCQLNTWVIGLDSNRNIIWNKTYGSGLNNSSHEKNAVKRIGERDFMIAGYIRYTDNHSGDVDCEPYPINSGKSAWIYRLYDPDTGGLGSLQNKSLRTYPNPATNQIFIDLPEHNEMVEIDIIDVFTNLTARLVTYPKQTQIIWNCSNVSSGVYFYHVEIGGKNYSGKILVE